MRAFTFDFAGFVLGACLVSAPACAVIYSFARDARPSGSGVIREGSTAGTRLVDLGAQEAQSRPRTGEAHTGRKGLAKSLTPGYVKVRPASMRSDRSAQPATKPSSDNSAGSAVGPSHSVRYVPPLETSDYLREPGAGHLRQMATAAAALCGVPPALLHALIQRESSWRQWDRHGRVLRSTSGALGLTQIKASTAREVGPSDPHQPFGNLLLGSCYLRRQFDRFGTWERALLAYRLGPRGLSTREARAYVDDIMEGSAQ